MEMKSDKLDVIVPISLELDWPTKEGIVREILEQRRNYGIVRFALAVPCGGWRSIGFPCRDFFRERAELFHQVREELAPHGVSCGWWITLTIKSGPTPEWSRMVRSDGVETPFASCPLNENFCTDFAESVALFAEIAKPDFIVTEDDFSINAATGYDGCYCALHLAEFARRRGKNYTREELKRIFEEKTPESFELLREWRTLMRDSLVQFAAAIRRAVDRKTPEIPMGTMQPGAADRDGDSTEAVARAMAGERHTPFSRLYGTFYGGENIGEIPDELFHPLYSKQHIGKNFRFYHESDTFPHTRFFTSGASMRTIMSTVYSFGFDGSTFQTQQLLDDANEETIYGKMFAEESSRFEAIHVAAKQCRLCGAELWFDPFWGNVDGETLPSWTKALAYFGIPYTTVPSDVAFLSGTQPAYMNDTQIKRYLSGKIVLDGAAAKVLCERGYGEFIGAEVSGDAISGYNRFDLGGREVIESAFIPDCRGRHMHRAEFFSPHGNGKLFAVTPREPDCEVITRAVTFQKKSLGPEMTRFKNRLGGSVLVMGMTTGNNNSSSLFNYRRQRLIQEFLVWNEDKLVFVKDAARIFLVMNEAQEPVKSGFLGMLTLTNLCPDDLESVTLHLPEKWRHVQNYLLLDQGGKWTKLDCVRTEDGIIVNTPLRYTRPVVLLAKISDGQKTRGKKPISPEIVEKDLHDFPAAKT